MPTLDPHPSDVMELLRRRGPGTRIAVAGASTNPEKYGNKIVRNLKGKGYTVLPVNPKEDLVEGLSVAHSIGELEKPVDILVMVTPPPATLRLMKEAADAGLSAVWLQDGSFDDAVLEFAATAPFKTVHDACVMVASNF
ncbi:MAG: CoA-binding protein [Acidobacteriia bacterium]|nr:CoA-binding protein [Terriglobia bacterium]